MKLSIGICVGSTEYLYPLLGSAIRTCINAKLWTDDFEILMIGNMQDEYLAQLSSDFGSIFSIIPFDDARPGWITRKKNILARAAQYENLCIVHDYLKFDENWLSGVLHFNDKPWKVLLNRVENLEGTRHADWIVDPECMLEVIKTDPERLTKMLMSVAPKENGPQYVSGLPYMVSDLSHTQYVSGGSFLVKRDVLLENPFNEDMIWGDAPGEDVEWSRRLRAKDIRFTFNPYSIMHIQKPRKWYCSQMPIEFVEELRKYYGSKPIQ